MEVPGSMKMFKITQILIPYGCFVERGEQVGGPTHQPQRLQKSRLHFESHCAQTLDFNFRITSTPAMSKGLKYVKVDYVDACRRLRDNDASLKAIMFLKL